LVLDEDEVLEIDIELLDVDEMFIRDFPFIKV
jgi:hypothetical protein